MQDESPSAVAPEILTGSALIRDLVKRLPGKPGVYRMMDAKGDVIYVGKARILKNRVANYAKDYGHTQRIALMISLTRSMEFVTTETEAEALLLEANLIKRLKPRFNVVMRDDKSFPYILIAKDHKAAQLVKHRGARQRKGSYYGPFASAGAVNQSLNTLQKAFLLRSCSDSVYANRNRPCLLYQIKRCSAPCVDYISLEAYGDLVRKAENFLSGKSQSVKAELARDMEQAAESLEYERAARLRDRIRAMSFVTQSQNINLQTVEEADVFGLSLEGGLACVQVFFIRHSQNWGTWAYFPRVDKQVETSEILSAFISQFYDTRPAPHQILISHALEESDLLAQALASKVGQRVEIIHPLRGEKKTLVDYAVTNAREAGGRRLAESASQAKLLTGMAEAFGLESVPQRVEIYDNSHISGTHAVGAMVVAGPQGFMKAHYRKFNMRLEGFGVGDDFAMMREMLTRRFTRLLKEMPDQTTDDEGAGWPDLLLIDGGAGQLSAVKLVLAELGVGHIPVVGIAKGPERDAGREHFYMPGQPSFMLAQRDPVLYYVQRLRDEAHRFAIGTHRAKRAKAIIKSPLDEIPGIGPLRKKALLNSFGSARSVSRASVGDLAMVEGINQALATLIYNHFHETNE